MHNKVIEEEYWAVGGWSDQAKNYPQIATKSYLFVNVNYHLSFSSSRETIELVFQLTQMPLLEQQCIWHCSSFLWSDKNFHCCKGLDCRHTYKKRKEKKQLAFSLIKKDGIDIGKLHNDTRLGIDLNLSEPSWTLFKRPGGIDPLSWLPVKSLEKQVILIPMSWLLGTD